jgi:hypothetical protein
MAANPVGHSGVSRTMVGLLAAGSYAGLVGVVFLSPFLISANASANDVFLSNLFVGPLYYLVGSTLLIVSLAGLGFNRGLVLALALVNPVVVVALSAWLANNSGLFGGRFYAAPTVADAGILIAASAFVAGAHNQWRAWGQALLLAVAGAGVVTLASYLFGTRYYAFGETVSSVPPYLDLPVLGLSLALGIAIFVMSRAWSSG